MAVNKKLKQRDRARRRVDLARRGGNEGNLIAQTTRAALARASKRDDIVAKSNAVANADSYSKVQEQARDLAAAGEEADTRDAAAYTVIAQNTGRNSVEVQAEAMAVDEEREKYEQHIITNPTRYPQPYGPPKTISGDERLRLRDERAARQARYEKEGPVRVEDTEEHVELLCEHRAKHLAQSRRERLLVRRGTTVTLPDVFSTFNDGKQVFRVAYDVEAPPDEERTLWATQEEAHNQATRWREILGRPRQALRAAKAARGGVLNVQVHSNDDDLFCVKYKNKYRGKSRYVREPGTGGSYYYDWDAALQLKADYEKSNKDASWFVSAAEVRAVGKANQEAGRAKGRASQKRKRET